MTTLANEAFYRAQHNCETEGKQSFVYNPNNKPLKDLPFITGFNNGGGPWGFEALAISDNGHLLHQHICSHEDYMPHDLGVLVGSRPELHLDRYAKHYPEGYRMRFVSYENNRSDTILEAALKKRTALIEQQQKDQETNN